MKAIQVKRFGGPEVLEPSSAEVPSPGPGEVLVENEVAGVNFIDTYHRSGAYTADLPFIPGVEGGGIVRSVGDGVEGFKVGDRVTHALKIGSYAEFSVVPVSALLPVPEGLDMASAVALTVQGLTAHYLARSTFRLSSGSLALVHAGAGGVGRLLIQMGNILGATMIATVSTPAKAAIATKAGAQHVINYTTEDFVQGVMEQTDGKGVDVVYDSVGVDTFDSSLRCLHPRGLLCLFGQSSGAVPPIDPQILNSSGSLFLTRPSLHHYMADRAELSQRAKDIFGWLSEGRISVRIDRTLPLDQAAEAHRALEARETKGKVLLLIS